LHCQVNAALGKERELAIRPVENKKKVMVIGGGPAGMEVSRVAALRGHQVSLYEKASNLGGILPLAVMVKGEEFDNIASFVRYLETQVTRLNIKVHLGTEVHPELVEEIKPDVVIIATGGVSTVPEIAGIESPDVLTSAELYKKLKTPLKYFGPKALSWLTKYYMPIGKKVIVMGGLIQGCQVAVFLVKRGRKATIVETSDQLGTGMTPRYLNRLLPWFVKKGVKTLTGVKYERITGGNLTLVTREGKRQTLEANNIIVTIPVKPNLRLFKALEGKVPELYMIGACKGEQSGLIVDAIADGRQIGCSI
jgi:2,4-dienoyl-CoA reductase (NADPH2)